MATSKTLTPTNQTISIPEMSDAPNQSVVSNCITKLADAVNALQSGKDWTLINGVTVETAFQIPTNYNEIYVEGAFSSGQRICLHLIPKGVRQDSGFYYTSTVNGSGGASFGTDKKLTVYQPYFAGTATNYSSLKVWAR